MAAAVAVCLCPQAHAN